MRIVSLLPSTTEILWGIGAGPEVVGMTYECDIPELKASARIVSTTALPSGLSPQQIDTWVSAARSRGEDLYHLDSGALAELDADLIITQDLCAVCAVDVTVVEQALAHLGTRAEVLTIDPHTLDEVLDSVLRIGTATGHREVAEVVVADARERLQRVADAVAGRPRPRVAVLEWVDPPFEPGHWVPEMVSAAGGEPVLGRAGVASRRTTWVDVEQSKPDVVVVAPCGYDRPAAQAQADPLRAEHPWLAETVLHAADANASWARPGPRLVDGIEELASVLHPGVFPAASPLAGSSTPA